MYHQHFGLREPPFSIAVNPRYLYMSPRHRDALAHLLYGVGAGGGFILLTGEVGTGKTTLNRCLVEQLPDNADIAVVLNPALDARELLASVCDELGLSPAPGAPGLKALTDALHRFLLDNHRRGRKTVLLIDEAQHLDFEVLEQIRLLTNLETDEEKLLHIILIGQPELVAKLARPELRQLSQRITARYDLGPLTEAETGAYIRHRLQVAGWPAGRPLFPASVTRAIHRRSGGIPRLINLLCDRMLLGAYGRGSARLDRALLRQAAREVFGGVEPTPRPRPWAALLVAGVAVLLVAVAVGYVLRGPSSAPAPAVTGESSNPNAGLLQAGARTEPEPDPAAAVSEDPMLSASEGAALLASLYGLAPSAWPGPLSEGDRGAAVGAVALLFARLDGRDTPLATDRYTPVLAQRVRLFQRAAGLEVDGVVGEQTLRALLLAVWDALPAEELRSLQRRDAGAAPVMSGEPR